MTEVIQDCIKDGLSKEAIKKELKKSFPDKTSDSIRTMVNKLYPQAETSVAASPVKIEKLSKKELLELIKAKEEVPDTESHSESEAQESARDQEEEKVEI